MYSNTRNYILTAATALAMIFCPALRANSTITVNWNTQPAGDFATATISGTSPQTLLVFCLDGNQQFASGSSGSMSTLSTSTSYAQQVEEAALLASYDLSKDPTHSDATLEADIQHAIWLVMGTLNVTVDGPASLAAQNYFGAAVKTLQNYPSLFPQAGVQVWTPANWTFNSVASNFWSPGGGQPNANQRFISLTNSPVPVQDFQKFLAPEPGTMIFLGTGVLLMALSRIRSRRQ